MLPSMMSQPCPTSPAGLQEDPQPCLTGGRTGTVRLKREPTGRTDLSNRSQLVLCDRSQELIGQACPTLWQVLWSDMPLKIFTWVVIQPSVVTNLPLSPNQICVAIQPVSHRVMLVVVPSKLSIVCEQTLTPLLVPTRVVN
ncbi:hypothetical protein PCASD_22947 [Puccinia coronata f. sp. avenae]|uniref:Uncharacterized protein n=1 Tax=Puccinia coronata f. sp. avenae TaxID=200324 RepID=A0A2N5TMC7_9BASI|nr:hypothetical protein PCASD_22947 [Puccinia coronata f. sp. avenae]